MNIPAIETVYRGYRFRSRTEAKWAVFFDGMGIRWEYEPNRFPIESVGRSYLPDFYIYMRDDHHVRDEYPDAGYWVEVKGPVPTEAEVTLLTELCRGTERHGLLVYGDPGINPPISISFNQRTFPSSQREAEAWAVVSAIADEATKDHTGADKLFFSQISECWSSEIADPYTHFDIAVRYAREFRFGERGYL